MDQKEVKAATYIGTQIGLLDVIPVAGGVKLSST